MPYAFPTVAATLADSARAAGSIHPVTDSVVVKNPVPGGLGYLMNMFFNAPQWVHLLLVAVGLVVGGTAAWLVWNNREAILEWLRTRDRRSKIALATIAGVTVLVGAGGTGYSFWYMEHENDFCLGCHVMTPSWAKFEKSEHSKLGCHDCHRQSQIANARQLIMWIAERPDHIPEHAKVPTRICAECHIQKPGAEKSWQRIVATAGHRVHLASSDTALRQVQCVTCHGVEVHAFQPVDATCGQSGCHTDTKAKIVLGKMAGQTSLHCTGCHVFTVPVAENLSIDSTSKLMSPATNQCMDCHEMKAQMKGFDPSKDKHQGLCGNCHNPHSDKTAQDSWKTCGNAGCHTKPLEETPFHRGIPSHAISQCQACHEAHTWKAEGSSCLTCHKGLFADGPAPSAAPAAGRTVSAPGAPGAPAAKGTAHRALGSHEPAGGRGLFWTGEQPLRAAAMQQPKRASQQPAAQQPPARVIRDNSKLVAGERTTATARPFRHKTHRDLQCANCHSSDNRHGELTVKTPAQCQTCHHDSERARTCEGCHTRQSLAQPISREVPVKLTVWKEPRQRLQRFAHPQHRDLECASCHTKGPELAVTKECASCHKEHHEPARDCRACHTGVKETHEKSVHQGCATAGCHTGTEYANVPTARNVCLTCHVDMTTHKRGGECVDCHKMPTWPTTAGSGITTGKGS